MHCTPLLRYAEVQRVRGVLAEAPNFHLRISRRLAPFETLHTASWLNGKQGSEVSSTEHLKRCSSQYT